MLSYWKTVKNFDVEAYDRNIHGDYPGDMLFKKEVARDIKKFVRKALKSINAELSSWTVGYYYVSGFVTLESGTIVYFNIGDVRNNLYGTPWHEHVLVRKAKNLEDYRGEQNYFINIDDLSNINEMFG